MLDKIWTEKDYDTMNWHDCAVHSITFINDTEHFNNKLQFDIDYILEWRYGNNDSSFEFLVCPANLTFIDVHNLEIDISTGLVTTLNIEIDNINLLEQISRGNDYITNKWHIELHNGDIFFEAVGYLQKPRQPLILSKKQRLAPEQRR